LSKAPLVGVAKGDVINEWNDLEALISYAPMTPGSVNSSSGSATIVRRAAAAISGEN
jgi:hypothetical protein